MSAPTGKKVNAGLNFSIKEFLIFLDLKELNPRRRVYVEISKPSRVELKRGQNTEGLDVILATPSRVLVSQHRPDAEGLISILKCLKAKSYVSSLPGRVLVELPRPSGLRKRLMHFPFEIIIWDTKVF
jgi:hypothetical protein